MRIYIAAPFIMKETCRVYERVLREAGHIMTSRWHGLDGENLKDGDEWARKDIADVAAADALLAVNPIEWMNAGTGGRHVEFGAALMLGKKIVIIGVRSNIFHHMSDVVLIDTCEWEKLGQVFNAL